MSEDEGGKQRPNANYNLSRPDNSVTGNEELVFYYNRERRLEKAPEAVKQFYKNDQKLRTGFFYSLVADRPRKFLFLMIVLFCLGILLLNIFGYFDTTHSLDGNKIGVKAAAFEGTSIIVLKKTANKSNAYTGAVDIAVAPVSQPDGEYSVYTHRIFFSLEKEETYRFAVPFDEGDLLMELQSEKNAVKIKFKPD